jgi:hypothetical protein
MDTTQPGSVLKYIRELGDSGARSALNDGELLQRFSSQRDESAFAALLQRHGRLVWGVCRHVRLSRRRDVAH